MDASHDDADVGTDPDFTAKPFTTRREPIQEIIRSFGSLYLESEEEAIVQEEEEDVDLTNFPPPPPLDEEEDESLISLTLATKLNQLSMRIDKMEKDNVECIRRLEQDIQNQLQRHDHCLKTLEEQARDITKQMITQAQAVDQNQQKLEEKLTNISESRCNRLKQVMEEQMQDMSQAMMECLKRRDNQLKSMMSSVPNAVSTPIAPQAFATSFPVGQATSTSHLIPHKAAVRLEFPLSKGWIH